MTDLKRICDDILSYREICEARTGAVTHVGLAMTKKLMNGVYWEVSGWSGLLCRISLYPAALAGEGSVRSLAPQLRWSRL